MIASSVKKSNIHSNVIQVRQFLHEVVDFHEVYLVGPALLAFTAASLEGISIGLLIPTIKGVIEGDFSFVREINVLKNVISALPVMPGKQNVCIFLFLVIAVFVTAAAKTIFEYFSSLSIAWQVRHIANNLRKRIYGRYLSFGKMYFDQSSEGHLHQMLVGYTEQIVWKLHDLHKAFYSFFTFIVYMIILFAISWKLSVLVLAVFPVLQYMLRWLIEKIEKTSEAFAKAYSSLGVKISNALSCIPLIKAYSGEEKEEERFAYVSDLVQEYQFSLDKKQLFITPLREIVLLGMVLCLIVAMAFLLLRENHGQIAGFMVYFLVIKKCMNNVGFFNDIQASLASAKGPISELLNIFDDKGKHFVSDGAEEFNGLLRAFEFNHLDYSYLARDQVLKDITFSIEKGKITAIVGPSGAGKTTLISLILRLYDPPPSTIRIDGNDIRNFSLKSLRAHMALVSQDIYLFNDTLRMNLTYGLTGDVLEQEIMEALKKARLHEFVTHLPDRLDTRIGDRGIKLSGGEKQRLSIARAVLKESEILILDEATSSLDSKTERLIQEALGELVKEKTAIVVAHRLSTIKHADKIVVIENGRLVEEGSLQELLANKGKFYEYWEEQKFY